MEFTEFFRSLINEIFFADNLYMKSMFWIGIFAFVTTLVSYIFLLRKYKNFRDKLVKISEDNEKTRDRIFNINKLFSEQKKTLWNSKIKQIWTRYYDEYNHEGNETIPDPLYYYNTEELVNKAGYRKLVEVVPAVFVSLGLLGTFVGIVIALSNLNTNAGSEALFSGINTLLGGMSFAFYSSILGIILSLVYQLLDRILFYRSLQSEADKLMIVLDKTIPIETESNLLEKVVKAQETQLKDMKSFFTDQFLPNLTSGISESISSSISPQLEKSNEIMDRVAQNTLEAQSDSLNQMVDHFVESLSELTGNHIEKLGDALHSTVEWQEKVHSELMELVDELSLASKEQAVMAGKTTELSEQMNTYTEKLVGYQDKLSETTNELGILTAENTGLLSKMNETYDHLTNQHEEATTLFNTQVNSLNQTVEKITDLGSSFTELNQEMKLTLETIVETTSSLDENAVENQKLTESLIEQHELSNKWSTKTQQLLEDVSHNMNITEEVQQTLQNLFESVSNERTSLNQLQSQYGDTFTTSVQQLSKLWNENNDFMSNNSIQLTNLNESLSQSMESFAEHMHRGVQGTFEEFDAGLRKAVELLDRGVSSIGIVVEALEAEIDGLDGQFRKLNANLIEINTSSENRMIVNE